MTGQFQRARSKCWDTDMRSKTANRNSACFPTSFVVGSLHLSRADKATLFRFEDAWLLRALALAHNNAAA
jgi:hypothetical protein